MTTWWLRRGSPLALVAILASALVLGCGTPPSASSSAPAGTRADPAQAASPPQAASPAQAAPVPLRELKVSLVSKTLQNLPHWVGDALGYFVQEGFTVQTTYTSASTAAIVAVVSGSMDLTVTSPGNAIQARQKGTNLVLIGGYVNRAMYNLVGVKELTTIDDVRGKRIGVSGASTGDVLMLRETLASRGMRERDDYTFLRVGGTPERYTALHTGAIDAGLLTDPFNYAALDEGFPNLAAIYQYVPEYQHSTTIVNGDWARQNEAVLVGFQKALIRSIRWIYDPANAEAAVRIAHDVLGGERRYAEMGVAEHVRVQAWAPDGLITEKGLEWVIVQSAAVGELEPPLPTIAEITDQSYTRKALAQLDR